VSVEGPARSRARVTVRNARPAFCPAFAWSSNLARSSFSAVSLWRTWFCKISRSALELGPQQLQRRFALADLVLQDLPFRFAGFQFVLEQLHLRQGLVSGRGRCRCAIAGASCEAPCRLAAGGRRLLPRVRQLCKTTTAHPTNAAETARRAAAHFAQDASPVMLEPRGFAAAGRRPDSGYALTNIIRRRLSAAHATPRADHVTESMPAGPFPRPAR
jgi:hypothetical protein